MAKNLVIVESPAKAKTLKKFLGSSYKIEASIGHVRDLPKSELGIDTENDFEPKYITIRGKGEILSKLRKESKAADKVYLATDPDREGEAISWHLLQALRLDEKKASRITFNEITKNAVKKSIKEARKIDMNLVDAQQARRELDRIVGYKISPLLWKKVKKGLSAGRVQSVALKIICDREEEIENFNPEEYWTVEAILKSEKNKFAAKFTGNTNGKIDLKNQTDTEAVVDGAKIGKFFVKEVKRSNKTRKPHPPFTTSTLQQEASKLLGFATNKTMLVAQQLYEGIDIKGEGTLGLVSYIRTDSVRISDEAYDELKKYLLDNFGEAYANETKIEYKSRNRAQDAHEAIRPTYTSREPDSLKESLSKDQYRLYKLIWERFVASQMTQAVYEGLSIKIVSSSSDLGTDSDSDYVFRSSGSKLIFDGYLKIYNSKSDDDDEKIEVLPDLSENEILQLIDINSEQHFTQPPARYSEANLVKTMEELGIGRPSTYSTTLTNIVQRRYVSKENKVFYSTELGEIVNTIMKENFLDVVNIDFTAKMEDDLDRVEDGDLHWKEIIRQFYQPFDDKIKLAEEKISHIEIEDEKTDVICENCGRNMVIKYGRFGKFLACPGFPECRNAKPFFEEAGVTCPICGDKVLIKKTKKGRKYYGCNKNPECSFVSWNKPTGDSCPTCGQFLVEKGTKTKKIVCSNNMCSYSETKEIENE